MVCDYFAEASGPVCRARTQREIVVPTIMEEIRFCLTNKFRDCVHWQERVVAPRAERASGGAVSRRGATDAG
jgi:hypothetical protein